MVYFLINNAYHFFDVELLLKDLEGINIGLIQVPYSLTEIKNDKRFIENYTFNKFLAGGISVFFRKFLENKRNMENVKSSLHPSKDDILLVYTEYDVINQYIISCFSKVCAKIYLLEDGMATPILFTINSEPFSLRLTLAKYLTRWLHSLDTFSFIVNGKNAYPVMGDGNFTAAFVYVKLLNSQRNINIQIIKNNTQILSRLDHNSVLFLNQTLHPVYISFEAYLSSLDKTLHHLSGKFKNVYFKFHPQDKLCSEQYLLVMSIIEKYQCVLIDSKEIMEKIMEKCLAKYVVSYFSAALRNLAFMGAEPVFIYHLIPELLNLQISTQLTAYLKALDYNFPESLRDITPSYESGFMSNVKNPISIREALGL